MYIDDVVQVISALHNYNKNFDNIETLILGSSHARYSYIDSKTTLNLGFGSQDLYYTLMLYNKYKFLLPKLKNIVVFYSIFSPGNSIQNSPFCGRAAMYKAFFDIPYRNKIISSCDYTLDLELSLHRDYLPIALKIFEDNVNSHYPDLRNSPNYYPEQDMQKWASTTLKLNKLNNQNYLLENLLKDAKSNNLNVTIVISPYRSDYRKMFPPKNELFVEIFNFQKIYNFDIIDAYEDENLKINDFYDNDHLNFYGAQKLTKQINERLKI